MDNNDRLLEKLKLNIAISNFEQEENKRIKVYTLKEKVWRNYTMKKGVIIAFIISLMLGCTGVMATSYIVYEKIWKEPESYTYEEMISELPPEEVTEEEKKELITEDEAKQKGLEILEKLGYKNQTIKRVELKRGYAEDVTSYYMVKTKWGYEEGLMVQLNANGGDFIAFDDMDLKYKHLKSEVLADEEIARIATEYYNKLELKEGAYKLSKTKAQDYYFENKSNKLLGANFYKYYDGIANKYESFNVSFMAVNGEIMLNSILLSTDNTYQKNNVVITEDEAISIAKSKEKEFSPFEITNITSELSIEKMNAFIYQLENNKYDVNSNMEDETYYKTENIARKVWKIKLEHDVDVRNYRENHNKYIKEGMSKLYYVDATTGEIIGGSHTMFEN